MEKAVVKVKGLLVYLWGVNNMESHVGFSGCLNAQVTKALQIEGPGLTWKLRNLPNLCRGWRVAILRIFDLSGFIGSLHVKVRKADGELIDYGLVSLRVVTTAFVDFMVDQLIAETSTWGDFKYHDSGVGVTGAAVGNTDIETTDGEARATGTQVENAHNIYESVGTISYTTTKAITEHGLFNAASGVTLLDRHVFSAINVENGDSIEFTYRLTCTAGG